MLVEIGIGTFDNDAYKSYLMVIDTASSTIWIQCEDCRKPPEGHCFPQKEDPFPNSKSKSYIPSEPSSSYSEQYADGSYSIGLNAKETFTFPSTSSSSSRLKFPNIDFGCGTNNNIPKAKDTKLPMAGILGMGAGKGSFINQIVKQFGGKFSYCFVRSDMESPPPMYLRFGTNIKPLRSSKTIKLLKDSGSFYAVTMVDIGVNGKKLHLNEAQMFGPNTKFRGLVIDSGGELTHISKGAYDVVVKELDKYFSKYKREFKKESSRSALCYSRIKGANGYNNIPGVTFYFEGGAQLDIIPEGTFHSLGEKIVPKMADYNLFLYMNDQ
ncbi:unnamed protein product [Lupinus luteus]|uniref:Peptidase A1 domain-containing protein n=1 Tax=Lupinus luteus TaxID=3873 RepID=A0AAV1WHP3_LUPLU